jgi:hypothetical protein
MVLAGLLVPEGKLTLGSTAMVATSAELNLLDYDIAVGSSVAIADDDGIILHNADGAMEKIPASALIAYLAGSVSKAISTLTVALAKDTNWDASRASNDLSALPGTGFAANDGGDTELYVNGQLLQRGVYNVNPLLSKFRQPLFCFWS